MTKIKICGITNYEDAQNAIDLGADFLGFNFYNKSPRYLDYHKSNDIIQKLNGKSKIVGVFVNETIEKINQICNHCNPDLIQLSGDEDINFIEKLRKLTNKKIIKSFRIKNEINKINSKLINYFNSDYVMIDTFKEGFYGGTGKSFDLNTIKDIDNKKLFLGGGLNEKNVNAAIKKLNPFAVDVCSSIEYVHGKKDFSKMKQFIGAVKCRKVEIFEHDQKPLTDNHLGKGKSGLKGVF